VTSSDYGILLATFAMLGMFAVSIWIIIEWVKERDRWVNMLQTAHESWATERALLIKAAADERASLGLAWAEERKGILKDASEDRAHLLNRIMSHDFTEYVTMQGVEDRDGKSVLRPALSDQEEYELEEQRRNSKS